MEQKDIIRKGLKERGYWEYLTVDLRKRRTALCPEGDSTIHIPVESEADAIRVAAWYRGKYLYTHMVGCTYHKGDAIELVYKGV